MTVYRVGTADPPWECKDQLPGDGRGATKHYGTMATDQIANMPYERTTSFRFPEFADHALMGMWRLAAMQDDASYILQQWKFKSKSEMIWAKYRPCTPCRGTGWQLDRDGVPMSDISGVKLKLLSTGFMGCTNRKRPIGLCYECDGSGCGTPWFGMGRYCRNSHETCILATRGAMASKIKSHSILSMLHAPMPWNWDTNRPIHSAKPEVFYTHVMQKLAAGPYVEMFGRRRRPGWTVLGNQVGALRRVA